ncbi:class I SAM-dependent DNA methyltransferase [Ornithinibacillus scapharcae]|uniref:class I SAM-dependent DNA methyltransferase n=1 Tax=Ornithinibacillus scapharcae TaxID=1147159 RepID=UPI000225BAA7|nr:class I SAM-dependent methyltransferase [Ornithinibacillus scapharcae]
MKLENLQEYENPTLYDYENEGYTADINYLLKWAKQFKGTIIDLACGTGRATIPMADVAERVIGVDIHPGMLDQARMKSTNLPIKWVEQDCTQLNLEVQSPLIYMVGNSFQHFLTNEAQDLLLSSVHNHLEDGGVFIFSTRFPSKEELLQPAEEEYWRSYQDPTTGHHVDVYTISNYDQIAQVQHYTTIRRSAEMPESRTEISLRYVYPKEMKRLAEAHGFEVLHMFQDWEETPLSNDSYDMICVLKKK